MFQNFKDAYFVRGQINLLQKKIQRAAHDFSEYNNIAEQEYYNRAAATFFLKQSQTKIKFKSRV
jgi:hypothetical protein